MRFAAFFSILIIATTTVAQNPTPPTPSLEAKSATVPITLDHNRIVIDVAVALADGSTQSVRAWVDNGDQELTMSQRVAKLMGLAIRCEGQNCSAQPPREITIGGMKISLATVKAVNIPGKTNSAASIAFPGMSAEINIPSAVLRNYDVLTDFPERKLTIGQPGSLKFNGVKTKAVVNAESGLIQIPSQVENKKYNLALDLGSSISFLTQDVFEKLAAAHPGWPHMTGAIGPANMWGLQDEAKWKLLRVARLQYGPLFLTNVTTVEFPKDRMDFFEKRAGIPTAGLLGSNALINYRIGLDYAHATVYFDIGRLFNSPDFDVVGLILRPDDDGRFTILGIADYGGKPSVPELEAGDRLIAVDGIPTAGSTLGQVWSMLGGEAGKGRRLTVERAGKQLNIAAKVQHFLGEQADGAAQEKSQR
jgi:hypothetical protein